MVTIWNRKYKPQYIIAITAVLFQLYSLEFGRQMTSTSCCAKIRPYSYEAKYGVFQTCETHVFVLITNVCSEDFNQQELR